MCCIYATAPFIEVADLLKAQRSLEAGDWSYVFAATTYPAGGSTTTIFPEY